MLRMLIVTLKCGSAFLLLKNVSKVCLCVYKRFHLGVLQSAYAIVEIHSFFVKKLYAMDF